MKTHLSYIILLFLSQLIFDQHTEEYKSWQSEMVQMDSSGRINYKQDARGNRIPDFSAAGYAGGGVELPELKVGKTISALPGDNTEHIQKAIDELGAMPLINGFRAALLLKSGLYRIDGSIHLRYNGIVLRGEGQGDNPATSTILLSTDTTSSKSTLLYVGNNKKPNDWRNKDGIKIHITDKYVPVGSTIIRLASTKGLKQGDQIIIQHDDTEKWLKAIGYGIGESDTEPWTLSDNLLVNYNRYIISVDHKRKSITIDAPVFYGLDKRLSESYVYKISSENIIKNVGVENLSLKSCFNLKIISTYKEYGSYQSDEKHAWTGLKMISVESAWAKNITVKGFSGSGIILTYTTRATVDSCSVVDPISQIWGGRRYAFNTADFCQLVLFRNCYARNARHSFISNGTSTASGNVFLYCTSDSAFASSEGHRKWNNGFLFDNYKEINYNRTTGYTLAFLNRGSYGTSHGWAMVTGVAWNCDLTAGNPQNGHLIVQQPPTGQNYAIGCKAAKIDGNGPFKGGTGYIEGTNRPGLYPESLYNAQLKLRLVKKSN